MSTAVERDINAELLAVIESSPNRQGVVELYAEAIRLDLAAPRESRVDWPTVNRAIEQRWSLRAIDWIKHRAWRRVNTWPQKPLRRDN